MLRKIPAGRPEGRDALRARRDSGILIVVRGAYSFLSVGVLASAVALLPVSTRASQQAAGPQKAVAPVSAAPVQGSPAEGANAAPKAAPSASSPAGQPPVVSSVASLAPITTVVLDPAHGGPDSGARGASGPPESEVVLDFARAVRVSLEAQGLRVLLTREGDQDPSFDERSSLIDGLRGAVFISLHVASTGPVGTARAYWYAFPPDMPPAPPAPNAGTAPVRPDPRPVTAVPHPGLIDWDHAQQSFGDASRRLAELVQIQLAQKMRGSPDMPSSAAVRQLRTIAAPAIAIEVSSIAISDGKRLTQLNQPLADAVARAVVDFRAAVAGASAVPPGGAQ